MTPDAVNGHARLLRIACGISVAAILLAKIPLAWRINVNWDEFYFLNPVHALARGELDVLLQGAYAHLFVWVTRLDLDEIGQIVALRLSTWPMLALSCFLLYRLARRWASATGAWLAVFAFAASWPVLRHGISFRADSLLLPFILATFVFVGGGRVPLRRDAAVGLSFGVALAISMKAALSLPALFALVLFETHRDRGVSGATITVTLQRLATIAVTAALTAAVIVAVHSISVTAAAQPAGTVATLALSGGLLDVPWLPRWIQLQHLLASDAVLWVVVASGTIAAIVRRRFSAAACALSLLPVLFYRNAYSYYYVVMLAPACAVAAVACDEVRTLATRTGLASAGTAAIATALLLLAHNAWEGLMALRFDEQADQRAVVAAVHRIFPRPVPYIDHSGMIASFHKANFFMSTWGVERYLRQGGDFMPAALARERPPLLLVNHGVLRPGTLLFRQLREVDRKLLTDSYVDYWGPVRVAGIEARIPSGQLIRARLPFPGRYRVETGAGVRINGERFARDAVYDSGESVELTIGAEPAIAEEIAIRLVWADARRPPREEPPALPLYSPL